MSDWIFNVPDVSEHQPYFDFSPYANGYAILRAGYAMEEDSEFRRHVEECLKYNISFGVYWYSYALNVEEAIEEAKYFKSIIKGLPIKLGAWLDIEDADYYKIKNGLDITHDNLAPIAKAFLMELEKAGYYTGVYTSLSWLGYLAPECDAWDKWVAAWGNNDGTLNFDTSEYGTIQQYTSNGGELDENVIFEDPKIYLTGACESKPDGYINQPKEAPKTDNRVVYTVKSGDTLSDIADMYSTDYMTIANDNGIENPNIIYPGQQLVIRGEKQSKHEEAKSSEVWYTVEEGDTLSDIADEYGVDYVDIAELNNLEDPDLIYPGQNLRIK